MADPDPNDDVRPSLLSRLGNTTVKGLASATVWHLGNQFVPLITMPYLARVLGVESFGILAAGVALVAYAVLVTDWGFSFTSMQSVARQRADRDAVNQIIWATILAKVILAVIVIGVTLAIAWLVIGDPVLRAVVIVASISVAASAFNVEWALRGVDAFTAFAAAALIGKASTIPLVFLLVHSSADVPMAALSTALGNIVGCACGWWAALHMDLIRRPVLSLAGALRQIRDGTAIFLSTAASNIHSNAIMLTLALVSGPQQLGLFSGGDKLRRPFQGLLSPIVIVFFPQLNYLAETDPEQARERAMQVLLAQTAIAATMAVLLAAAAPIVVPLALGPEFAPGVVVLQVFCGVVLLAPIEWALGQLIMLPFGMKRQFTLCIVVGMLVGLAVMVPACSWWGAVGAAGSVVLAEGTIAICMFAVLTRTHDWFRPLSRRVR